MTAPRAADVLVVGAGPAGSVAAAELARRGLSVLLACGGGGGVQGHDVLVSGQAAQYLTGLGGPAVTPLRPVRAVRLGVGRAGRSIASVGCFACDAGQLRDGLRLAAVSAGAVPVAGLVTSIEVGADGYLAMIAGSGDGGPPVVSRHVIAATGVAGRAAGDVAGIACAQRFAGAGLRGRMLLALTPPAAVGPVAPPICAWAIPGANGIVTVGVARGAGPGAVGPEGMAVREDVIVPADLIGIAVEALAEAEPRLRALAPAGPLVSGPLDAGFTPDRLAAADYLLVGDAAGLVNPFTGEGLGYAMLSGQLAARSVAERPDDREAAREAYRQSLSSRFVGYFETARHASRRYHLTWRVLGAAASSDHPFFAKARRAILLPDGLTGIAPSDHLDLAVPDAIALMPFLAACDEVIVATIRGQWPFLARLMLAEGAVAQPRLRPALLLYAGLISGGARPDARYATVGAAIELAQLGALSFLGPPPAAGPPGRGVDWAAATTVLAGDFLLAQASRLVAESQAGISWSFAEWLGELAALRAARLGPTPADVPAGAVFASLLEFPARIGGLLGGCPAGTVTALREVGHHCGHAFLRAEDILALRGERTRLDATLPAMLRGRISAIGERADGWSPGEARAVLDRHGRLDREARQAALSIAVRACLAAHRDAVRATAVIPGPGAARMLRRFASAVAAPAASAPAPDGPGHAVS
ncbi:MAG TPA: hypothetical protein VK802_19505 [Streptosporangiaceae bacterium]|nr:hypothetical protein [Streptosporangiaceae bacterium]